MSFDSTAASGVPDPGAQDVVLSLLHDAKTDHPDAWPSIFGLLYQDLKKIARRLSIGRPADRTLNTTSLVNECYLRIHTHLQSISDRDHLLALSARVMRHVMCDYSRHRLAQKHKMHGVSLDIDLLDNDIASEAGDLVEIDDLLRQLESTRERAARVFECKYFFGMDDQLTANALDLSLRTVQREWSHARAWLREQVSGAPRPVDSRRPSEPSPQ